MPSSNTVQSLKTIHVLPGIWPLAFRRRHIYTPSMVDKTQRRLAAILAADVAGYTRLVELDTDGTVAAWKSARDNVIKPLVDKNSGHIIKFTGDGFLVEIPSVQNAVVCAITLQEELRSSSLNFRIGINVGDITDDGGDVHGEGVNIAARLEALAEPGGICISGDVYNQVRNRIDAVFKDMGEQEVKHVSRPVSVFAINPTKHKTSDHLTSPAPALPDKPSIAVLPFDNLTGDPKQEYFTDGMTDDLITDLSKVSGLFVIARHSVFTYKGKPIKVREVAQELGVRYVLEGSVRRAGGRIRINAQLIDATTDGHLWAERYEADETDVFTLQDRVIGNIVSALSVKLTDNEKMRLSRRPTDNLEAYDYYLRAGQHFGYGHGGLRNRAAISLYREAIALDPQFVEAYAALARVALSILRLDQTDALPGPIARKLAYESASKVLSLDPDNPRAYGVLAMLQASDGRHELALESAQKAVSLDPNNAVAYTGLATVLVYAGRHAKALEMMQTAFRLDPKPPNYFHGELALALFFNRRYAEAIEHLEKTREAVPYDEELAMTYAELGRLDEAKVAVERLYENVPFANLAYYRALWAHYKRKQDLEHLIGALRKADIPEWPYGYQSRVEDRLDSFALEALMSGRTWVGHDFSGAPFIQQFTDDGRIALRSRASLLSGTAQIRDDMVCIRYPAALLGREDCGYVYRNASGSPEEENEYVRVALGEIYYFSVAP